MMRYDILAITLILLAVTAVAADIITKKRSREKIAVFFALAAIIVFSSAGLLKYENIVGQDGYFHIMRILGMAENINRGIPFAKVNYVFNQGYGYFDPVFYTRIFLWIPAVMVAVGMNISNAYRIFLLLINVATVLVSYKCFDRMSQNKIWALAVSAMYTLNYYRMNDLYLRASIGELLFIAFFPMVLYGIYAIFRKGEDRWFALMLGATFILQSHMIGTLLTAMTGIVMIAAYGVYNLVKNKSIKAEIITLVKAGIGTVAVNLWFLLPLAYYIRQDFVMFTVVPEYFAKYQQPFFDMFFKRSDLDGTEILSHMGPLMGCVFVLIIAAVVIAAIKAKKIPEGTVILLSSVLVLFTASVYMPWTKLAANPAVYFVIDSLQFSFRTISVFLALLAMAAILFLGKFTHRRSSVVAAVLTVLFCLSAFDYYGLSVGDRTIIKGYDGEYEINTFCPSEYLLNAVNKDEVNNPDKLRTLTDELVITSHEYIKAGSEVVVENRSAEDNYIEIPLFYYDGYSAYSVENDMYLPVQPGLYGVIRVVIPPEVSGKIVVQFATKWFFRIANGMSMAAALFIAGYLCIKKRKKRY